MSIHLFPVMHVYALQLRKLKHHTAFVTSVATASFHADIQTADIQNTR